MNRNQFVETDTNLEDLAHFVHGEICNCDDKTCTVETDVLDWLKAGDPYGMRIADVCQNAEQFIFED